MEPNQEHSLFFAGSDDEDMGDVTRSPKPKDTDLGEGSSSGSATRPRSPAQQPLFFEDSDSDAEMSYRLKQPALVMDTDGDDELVLDMDIPEVVEIPRASSVSSVSSGMESSHNSPPPPRPSIEEPAPKRRRLSLPEPPPDQTFDSMYLGYFLVDNAWSTVKGTGYIKAGEEILIQRDDVSKPPPPPPKKATKDKRNGGKKQLTIANMLKPAPTKTTKKKQDSVVRITNSRGFGKFQRRIYRTPIPTFATEFGRLPQDVASWVSRLLDLGKYSYILNS